MSIPDYQECENANSFDHPEVPIIASTNPNQVQVASWGLIPEWIKTFDEATEKANMLRNARSETIFEKSSFAPYISKKRCLIFLEGFYEWQHLDAKGNPDPKGKKTQPYYIDMKDKPVFAAGGIFTEWLNPETKEKLVTTIIITTECNPLMAKIHDRQPLIVPENQWLKWLSPELPKEEIKNLMAVYPDTNMKAVKIGEMPKSVKGEQQSLF